jgi:hypothetical protein
MCGGEGGIRTRDTLRYTRFPGERVRPDYATSPVSGFVSYRRAILYHSELIDCRYLRKIDVIPLYYFFNGIIDSRF